MAIESDELGHIGETKFQSLCAEVALICNQSHRDRAGWDFAVDFPQAVTQLQVFDKRPAPLSCLVQVKSINLGQRNVSIRLSAAERLAKDPKPAFVYIPSIDSCRSIKKAHLIHIHGNRLSSILQRLRQEAAAGNEKINRKYISFTITDGEEIETSAGALKCAFENYIQGGMGVYAEQKTRSLGHLGYEGVVASITTTLKATESEIIDIFLGLRTEVKAYNTTVLDRRFNISIEDELIPECLLTITPVSVDTCKVVATDLIAGNRATVKCEIFRPAIANLAPSKAKIRFKGKLLDLFISGSELNLAAQWGDDISASFDDWRRLMSFISIVERPGCEIEFISDSGALDWKLQPIEVSVGGSGLNPSRILASIEHLAAVLRSADVYDEVVCDFAWIERSFDHASLISKAMAGESQEFCLSGNVDGGVIERLQGKGAFSSVLPLPSGVIIYAGVGDFISAHDGERGSLSTNNLHVTRIRHYKTYSAELHKLFTDEFFSQNDICFCISTTPWGTALLRMND